MRLKFVYFSSNQNDLQRLKVTLTNVQWDFLLGTLTTNDNDVAHHLNQGQSYGINSSSSIESNDWHRHEESTESVIQWIRSSDVLSFHLRSRSFEFLSPMMTKIFTWSPNEYQILSQLFKWKQRLNFSLKIHFLMKKERGEEEEEEDLLTAWTLSIAARGKILIDPRNHCISLDGIFQELNWIEEKDLSVLSRWKIVSFEWQRESNASIGIEIAMNNRLWRNVCWEERWC